jgi:hypothetical protein
MSTLSILSITTIIQYALFGGIAMILFGWFEKKENLTFGGQAIFILSGIFAFWILSSDTISVPAVQGANIPKEVKVLSIVKLTIWLSALNLVSIVLGVLKNRFYKAILSVVILAALALFFLIIDLQQIQATK